MGVCNGSAARARHRAQLHRTHRVCILLRVSSRSTDRLCRKDRRCANGRPCLCRPGPAAVAPCKRAPASPPLRVRHASRPRLLSGGCTEHPGCRRGRLVQHGRRHGGPAGKVRRRCYRRPRQGPERVAHTVRCRTHAQARQHDPAKRRPAGCADCKPWPRAERGAAAAARAVCRARPVADDRGSIVCGRLPGRDCREPAKDREHCVCAARPARGHVQGLCGGQGAQGPLGCAAAGPLQRASFADVGDPAPWPKAAPASGAEHTASGSAAGRGEDGALAGACAGSKGHCDGGSPYGTLVHARQAA